MKITKDTIVWITGASSGIGAALAVQLSKVAGTLVLSARNEEKLQEIKNLCLDASNALEIFILPFDLSNPESVRKAAYEVFDLVPHIDIMINNGGISQRSSVIETDISVDRKILEVNFFGAIALAKSVLPEMRKRKSGHILTISSLVGKFGTPMRSAYAASKHALHGWFDALRAEVYADNISVTLFCPGYIRTRISVNALTASGDKHAVMDQNQQKGKSPEACARAIISAIEHNKQEAYFGGKEVFGVYLKRFFPLFFSKMLRKLKVNKS